MYASADAARVGGGVYSHLLDAAVTLATDPAPAVAGAGRAALRMAGVELSEAAVLAAPCAIFTSRILHFRVSLVFHSPSTFKTLPCPDAQHFGVFAEGLAHSFWGADYPSVRGKPCGRSKRLKGHWVVEADVSRLVLACYCEVCALELRVGCRLRSPVEYERAPANGAWRAARVVGGKPRLVSARRPVGRDSRAGRLCAEQRRRWQVAGVRFCRPGSPVPMKVKVVNHSGSCLFCPSACVE